MGVEARAPRIAQSAPARTEEGERPSRAARGSGAFLPQSVKARCGPRGSQNAPAQTEEGERPTRAARDSGACLPQSVGVAVTKYVATSDGWSRRARQFWPCELFTPGLCQSKVAFYPGPDR